MREPARFGPWRREVRAFLELFALGGIALAQPAFDLLKKNPALFVNRSATELGVVGLTLVFLLVLPVALWVIEVVAGLVLPQIRRYVHALLAAAVIAVLAIEVVKKQTALGSSALVVVGFIVGLAGGWLVLRFETVRLWLRYLSAAPVVFAILFLFFSPVTTVVFESDPSPAKVAVGKPNRVVMVVFDEFPTESLLDGTGRIDTELYPNFAALANEGTWYRNQTTVAVNTVAAVPALLTGNLPSDQNGLLVAASNPENLFTLLGDTYEMNVHESATRLCPTSLCGESQRDVPGGQGFRGLLQDGVSLWRDFASPARQSTETNIFGGDILGDRQARRTGRRFVRSLQPTDQPRLDFLHIMMPHEMWHYLPTGQDYFDRHAERVSILHAQLVRGAPAGLLSYKWSTDWTALLGRQRHLLQVAATDRLLGEIVARLKRIGAYDDSLLVVTADHGVAFTQGNPIRGLSEQNYSQIVWAPLFIKTPHQAGPEVVDEPSRTIDIVPTIAEHLNVKMPWRVDGRSLMKPAPPDQPVKVFEWSFSPWKPPPGKRFVNVPARRGFATMLQGQASQAAGDAALRLYQIGPYAGLFGQPAQALERAASVTPTGTLQIAGRLDRVDPDAQRVPWAYVQGTVKDAESETPLAIAVNGIVAGFSATYNELFGDTFWTVVPPQLFRKGSNEVRVYVIRGDPTAPELIPVRTEG